jgi:PAS domain S-box-containing protein
MAKSAPGWWSTPPLILKYGLSFVFVAGALAIAIWLADHLVGAPVPLFLCAIMFVAWFGGIGPGLIAVGLSILSFKYYFVPPIYSLAVDAEQAPRLLLLVVSAFFVGSMSAAQRSVTDSLRRTRDELSGTVEELRRSNEALRESEQRFHDYAETASDWLWETGLDHGITRVSEHGLNAIGGAPVRRIGVTRWSYATDVESEPEKWRLHRAMLDAHQPFRDFMYSVARGDGSAMYIQTSGKPFFDTKGSFLGYRGVSADITAAVRADQVEEALRKVQAELAHVTRVTTLGELTASIAHEVNQPLAAIVANGDACLRWLNRDVPELDEVRGAVAGMINDGNRAADVIRRVRALAKKTDTLKAPLPINEVIDEVIQLLQREVLSHRASARLELASELPLVLVDRIQLQQVIINLVMNGMEAMAPVTDRPRELKILSRRDADQVLVAVQDSGVGIDPGEVDRLFNAFFTTKPAGMGMGLSICRSIIEAHGGKLWASRNVGAGATFQFTLPAYREPVS